VHCNLRLLSHYYEEVNIDKNLKTWDNNPEEDNLEDGVLVLEQLENALVGGMMIVLRCHPHPLPWSPCPGF
jgi:hypothetical protein